MISGQDHTPECFLGRFRVFFCAVDVIVIGDVSPSEAPSLVGGIVPGCDIAAGVSGDVDLGSEPSLESWPP